ncbi:MAG TPA: adenylate/guanylate cyclase domain-containing protein [Gammaproteobacteria bacterium]|nr:adenylate/guanylate cyclase domain-containing protein [Gammaproteobacteria bacterium]
MSEKTETLMVILFADVCNSTRLYDTLGDIKARETIAYCLSIMTTAINRNRGRLVKTMGDEVMASFRNADDAAQVAVEMQQDISHELIVGDTSIMIHVGFHFGAVLAEGRDIFGDAVNTAARLTSQAKPAQILTSLPTVEQLSNEWRESVRKIDHAALRGKRNEMGIHELMWQREDVTRMATDIRYMTEPSTKDARLILRYLDHRLEISTAQSAMVMGRADNNDLIIHNGLVSRSHARIELRKGNFILTDQSINGTYVTYGNGDEKMVRRDSLALHGEGMIGLGQPPEPGAPEAIHFSCLD